MIKALLSLGKQYSEIKKDLLPIFENKEGKRKKTILNAWVSFPF